MDTPHIYVISVRLMVDGNTLENWSYHTATSDEADAKDRYLRVMDALLEEED